MKPFLLGAAVCLFSSLLAAQTTTSFHSTAEGAFALVNTNNTAAVIEVDRGNTATFLNFSSTTPGPGDGFTFSFGFGTIPNNDFVTNGSSLQQMALNVDTSQVPGFQSTTCTVSFTPFFTETCGQGPLGLIQLNWIGNGISTLSILEERHTTQGGLTVDVHRNADQHSANASGSYLGSSVTAASVAATDTNKDTTITFIQ